MSDHKVLTTLAEGAHHQSLRVSADGAVFAYQISRDGKKRIVTATGPGEICDDIGFVSLSNRGARMAFTARRGGYEYVVADGKSRGPYHLVTHPIFSHNGARLAFGAASGGRWCVVVDDRPGEAFEAVRLAAFSPDGRAVAYPAKSDGRWFVVCGGERQAATFDEVGRIEFDSRGVPIAFTAKEGNLWYAVVRGEKRLASEAAVGIAISPGDDALAYCCQKGRQAYLYQEDQEVARYPVILQFAWIPPRRELGFVAKDAPGGRPFLVAGNKRHPSYGMIQGLVFSPTGVPAYKAYEAGVQFAVIGDKRGEPFDWVSAPHFVDGGERVAYAARKDRDVWWQVVSVGE